MGVPLDLPAVAAEIDEERAKTTFEVFEDNWQAVMVFLCLQTQWVVVGGMAPVWTGINYASIRPVLVDLMQIPRAQHREMFNAVRIMEMAALPLLNSKQKREQEENGG